MKDKNAIQYDPLLLYFEASLKYPGQIYGAHSESY
jgi:hypothetical protein